MMWVYTVRMHKKISVKVSVAEKKFDEKIAERRKKVMVLGRSKKRFLFGIPPSPFPPTLFLSLMLTGSQTTY
jgi:hypothetical protein